MFARKIRDRHTICANRETILRLRWNDIIDCLDGSNLAGDQKMMAQMIESNKFKYKINNIISWLMVTSMIATLFLLLYWMYWPYKIIDIRGTNIKTHAVKPGQYLIYELKYNKYLDIIGDVDRRLVNHIVIPLVSHEGFRRALGEHETEIHVWIPRATPPGTYRLSTTISYDVNPLRTERISYDTPPFKVIDGK